MQILCSLLLFQFHEFFFQHMNMLFHFLDFSFCILIDFVNLFVHGHLFGFKNLSHFLFHPALRVLKAIFLLRRHAGMWGP